ncbi:MAG: EAL domain-containing protein [Gammaproteobacteria bacterium]|nr:EAL domain-containing protein [Gammaproteobacteria bacterium]
MIRKETSLSVGSDDLTASVAHDQDRSTRIVDAWYRQRASSLWCAVNIIAGLSFAVIGWDHVPHSIMIAWLLFTSLNGVLYLAISHGFFRRIQDDFENSTALQFGMALAFGTTWGVCFLIIGVFVPLRETFLLLSLCLVVSVLALPVFAFHRGAYPAFAIPVAAFAIAGLNGNPNVEYVELCVGLALLAILVLATIYAKFVRTVVTTLNRFIGVVDSDQISERGALSTLFEQRIRALNRLVGEQRRATATLDAIGEAIVTTNEDGLIDYMNPVAEVLTGVEFKTANGRRIEDVVNISSHGQNNMVSGLMESSLSAQHVQSSGERTVLKRRDGVEYEVEYQISAIRDHRGEIAGSSCLLRDVTIKRNLLKNVAWRSTHDPLTNLINRTEFEDRIKNLLEAATDDSGKRHALCFVDFDQFKFINETHGVEGGDYVLKSIALELKQKIRGADTLARIGEDKFAALLYSCPVDKARLIAEGLRRLVENFQADWDGVDLSFSVSIGVIEIDPSTDELSDVLSGAEAACECAKKDSGNRVHVSYSDVDAHRHRSDSAKRLRDIQSAIHSDRFELYLQQIHPIRGGDHEPRTCELLLRMREANGEVLSPRDFVIAAERYHLMPSIDRWVTKAAVDALRVNHPALSRMETACIGISGQSINDDRFLEFVVELLDEDVDGNRICFDIAEATLISSIERAHFFIATLKEFGCRVALDDIGLGVSSFELLKCLQLDYLKIGSSFVRNMTYNSADYEIVLALSRIAKTLGIRTIAEGVTTLAAKDSLMGMGVDYVQGFLIDRPHPLSDGRVVTH